VKGEASLVPEEMEEEVVGIASSSSRRSHVHKEGDIQAYACKEGNDPSGLEFITVKSDAFIPPKSEIEGSYGQLLTQFKVYPRFRSSLRETDLPRSVALQISDQTIAPTRPQKSQLYGVDTHSPLAFCSLNLHISAHIRLMSNLTSHPKRAFAFHASAKPASL
jgi:hypothetical protein